jgi:hypothetical protein
MRRVNGLVVTASIILAAAASPHAHATGFDVQGCIERAEGAYSYTLNHRCAGLNEFAAEMCRRAAQALRDLDKATCHITGAPYQALEASKKAMKTVGGWWPF